MLSKQLYSGCWEREGGWDAPVSVRRQHCSRSSGKQRVTAALDGSHSCETLKSYSERCDKDVKGMS